MKRKKRNKEEEEKKLRRKESVFFFKFRLHFRAFPLEGKDDYRQVFSLFFLLALSEA